MNTNDFLTPDIEVTINNRARRGDVVRMRVDAERVPGAASLASISLVLANQNGQWQTTPAVADRDVITVKWGWRGETLTPLFDGTVHQATTREVVLLNALDRCRSLVDTRVTRTYRHLESVNIVRDLVAPLGFASLSLADARQQLVRLPLCNDTVADAIRHLDAGLEITLSAWADQTGNFHWDAPDIAQASVATITEAEEVESLTQPCSHLYRLVLARALPSLWHSQVVTLRTRDGQSLSLYIDGISHWYDADHGARTTIRACEVAYV